MTDIPGNVVGSLLNILEYNSNFLSVEGFNMATQYKLIRDIEEQSLKKAAKELDDLFEVE